MFVVRQHTKNKVNKSSTEVNDSDIQLSTSAGVIELEENEAYVTKLNTIPIQTVAYSLTTDGIELEKNEAYITNLLFLLKKMLLTALYNWP